MRQTASVDALAPGAPSYSQLSQNLANQIVNLYVCPADPGSTAKIFFNRDGVIDITGYTVNDFCPNPNSVDITFTVEALQQLSIPPSTPVTFYYNNPAIAGATPILTWYVPCAISAGDIESFTVNFPIQGAANVFAVLNDDGMQNPPIVFPLTDIEELVYLNNIDDTSIEKKANFETKNSFTSKMVGIGFVLVHKILIC